MTLGKLVRVRIVQPLDGLRVHIEFDDGTQKNIDLAPFLWGPIFETIRNDSSVFKSMQIVGGAITWDNGADIDPDVLYYDLKPARMEKRETA